MSAAGAVVQVAVGSLQASLMVRRNSPPTGDGSTAYRRSFALVTDLPAIPETENFMRMFLTGLLSTWSVVAEP